MVDYVDKLKRLYNALNDSIRGYEEALKDAESKALTPLFREVIARRREHAGTLAERLRVTGQKIDDKGSFKLTVRRTAISFKSALTSDDESTLAGLIEGEERVRGYYESAIKGSDVADRVVLVEQRVSVDRKIAEMKGI